MRVWSSCLSPCQIPRGPAPAAGTMLCIYSRWKTQPHIPSGLDLLSARTCYFRQAPSSQMRSSVRLGKTSATFALGSEVEPLVTLFWDKVGHPGSHHRWHWQVAGTEVGDSRHVKVQLVNPYPLSRLRTRGTRLKTPWPLRADVAVAISIAPASVSQSGDDHAFLPFSGSASFPPALVERRGKSRKL